MTSVLDLWRAIDPAARLVSGSMDHLARLVRGIARTRAAAPHLPDLAEGALLVADTSILVGGSLDALVAALHESSAVPVAIWLVTSGAAAVDPAGTDLPVLLGGGSVSSIGNAGERHLEDEAE